MQMKINKGTEIKFLLAQLAMHTQKIMKLCFLRVNELQNLLSRSTTCFFPRSCELDELNSKFSDPSLIPATANEKHTVNFVLRDVYYMNVVYHCDI